MDNEVMKEFEKYLTDFDKWLLSGESRMEYVRPVMNLTNLQTFLWANKDLELGDWLDLLKTAIEYKANKRVCYRIFTGLMRRRKELIWQHSLEQNIEG